MEFIQELITGYDELDEQHREIIARLNMLIQVPEGSEILETEKTLKFLEDYIFVHFTFEEELSDSINYPYHFEHKQEHNKFSTNLIKLKSDYVNSGYTRDFLDRLTKFALDWLTEHIAKNDIMLVKYYRDLKAQEQTLLHDTNWETDFLK